MTQAYVGEKKAPPFGIYIDKSARAFASQDSEPFSTRWHVWFSKSDDMKDLKESLTKYFDWSRKMTHCLPYNEEKINVHENMCNQYLNYFNNNPV